MLPRPLGAALPLKNAYRERLRASMLQGKPPEPSNLEIDRFFWEQQLYAWAKEVIYKDSRAAEIFSSYSEEGARSLCQFITDQAEGVYGKLMLYVGSGNDRLVTLPLEQEGAFIVNLDIASEPLEDLRAAGAKSCVCGDARRLPFPAEAFDVVFSKGSIHHSHPIAEPLGAMVRVLKRGGHIVVAEPSKYMLSRLPSLFLPPKLAKAVGAAFKALRPEGEKSGLGYPTPYEDAISAGEVIGILGEEGISRFQRASLSHAPPVTPAAIARLWERLGNAMPWLFDRFAFEFMVYGRKI
ncbi:MAG: class I SAM-dependent methyltransferase [Dehalococcoidia bacterium]